MNLKYTYKIDVRYWYRTKQLLKKFRLDVYVWYVCTVRISFHPFLSLKNNYYVRNWFIVAVSSIFSSIVTEVCSTIADKCYEVSESTFTLFFLLVEG